MKKSIIFLLLSGIISNMNYFQSCNNTLSKKSNTEINIRIGYNSAHSIIDSSEDNLMNYYSGKNVVVGNEQS